jgi:hypothetical protein
VGGGVLHDTRLCGNEGLETSCRVANGVQHRRCAQRAIVNARGFAAQLTWTVRPRDWLEARHLPAGFDAETVHAVAVVTER